MPFIVITGRQSALSIAELESLFGASSISVLNDQAVQVDSELLEQNANNLGGAVKITKLLSKTSSNNWQNIVSSASKILAELALEAPDGKITLGLSCINLSISPARLNATGLEFKKALKKTGRSVRIVPNKDLVLNSAAVLHNKLTKERGIELVFIGTSQGALIARTVHEQDIESYAARDQARPMRDPKVGMLPPKLAQIIINLAIKKDYLPNHNIDTVAGSWPAVILDPFCGTGVVLQEGQLMNFTAYGTDLDERMVDYSRKNLQWLNVSDDFRLEVGDATTHQWQQPFSFIACETYLGRPLQSLPDRQTLQKIMNDCDTIHKKFLKNVAAQTKPGFRMCIAVPAWKINNGFLHLKTLDSLEELGYNRLRFVHVRDADLIYHRKDQYVARELVVLERK